MKASRLWIYSALLSSSLLTACGGGDDANTQVSPTPTPTPTPVPSHVCDTSLKTNTVTTGSNVSFTTETKYFAGQPASVVANYTAGNSQGLSYKWTQTAGPITALTSTRTPVLSFTPQSAELYQFTVSITGNGLNLQETVSVTPTSSTNTQLKINADHQVVSGGGVSFRAQRIDSNTTLSNVKWCVYPSTYANQITLDVTNPEKPLFTAPNVTQDTLVSLKATATHNGQTFTDDVHVLVTKELSIKSTYFTDPLARTYPYKSTSAYASALPRCVYSTQLTNSCNILQELPLIGQVTSSPTVDDIMDRVVVSHDWMGKNFKLFLEQQDTNGDFKRLLQSVTAIVISYDVRPSFYWVLTGAIYLDPEDLWLTPEQRDSINEAPDYRSSFGNELQFLMPWRYTKNNAYSSAYYDRARRVERTIADLTPDLASLMYHELAHANDFFPRSTHSSIQGPRLLDDFYRRTDAKALVSDQLTARYPLTSEQMRSLATVSFKGEKASTTQKGYVPGDITSFFTQDIASDYYAYSSTREDAAMLFEEALMSHRYKIIRDVAVSNSPANRTGDNMIVNWGQRGRIGDVRLYNRASYVIDQLLPEVGTKTLMDNLPKPIAMRAGQSWNQNLSISTANTPQQIVGMTKVKSDIDERPVLLSGER